MKKVKANYTRALDIKNGVVEMNHGSGGRAQAQLLTSLFLPAFDNPELQRGDDGAVLNIPQQRLVVSTDAHVVSPLFFPGGDIGLLAVHGSINDVAMMGARPVSMTSAFVLEEGLPLARLQAIINSMGQAAKSAGANIVAGDTKVVERGKGDGVFITTTAIGVIESDINWSGNLARAGDAVVVSGNIGDHGMAILSQRENLDFVSTIQSDSQPLHEMVQALIKAKVNIRCMRDPTRGGLATTLNEIAQQSQVGMRLIENNIPVNEPVKACCEWLGIDPLYVANEGKAVIICAQEDAELCLQTLHSHPLGNNAAIIGKVVEDSHNFVQMETAMGGKRIVDWLSGEPLPRIC